MIFSHDEATLKEGVCVGRSVRRSVGPSVRRSVGPSVRPVTSYFFGFLGATNAVYGLVVNQIVSFQGDKIGTSA